LIFATPIKKKNVIMKALSKIAICIFLVSFVNSLKAQDQSAAEQAVILFMKTTYSDNAYEAVSFGKIIIQPYAESVDSLMKKEKKVVYSIPHTLIIDGTTYKNEFFHFDEHMTVIGHFSEQEMRDIMKAEFMKKPEIKELIESGVIDTIYFNYSD
jgi:hypothetical protein